MQHGTNGEPLRSVFEAAQALGELVAALLEVPQAYDAFIRLSANEQVHLVAWIDDAANPRNRARRVQLISAVLKPSDTETVTLEDTIWLDRQVVVNPE
jgi:uncharacterized protein YdeI (YjbR/CyaY-like superfamily)